MLRNDRTRFARSARLPINIGLNGSLKTSRWSVDLLGQTADGTFVQGAGVVPAVPEPSTCAMMILGFGALSFFAYRRRTAAMAR